MRNSGAAPPSDFEEEDVLSVLTDVMIPRRLLYGAGARTDSPLLKSDEEDYPLDVFAPESDIFSEKLPSPAHSPSIPDAFSGTWARGLDSIELHAYAVSFEANHKDRAYVNFGLFLESDLGPEAGTIEVELQLNAKRLVIAKCSPCGTMVFDPNQLGNAKLFQESVFSALLDRKPGIRNSGDWSPDRLYLLLPLKEKQESSYLLVDWDSIEKVISDVEYFSPDGVPSEIPGSSLVRLSDGYVPVNHVTNSLVQTMHNAADKEWLYCARERIPNLTAESPMIMKDPKYSSYSDYYERKHNTRLNFFTQPMVEAKLLEKVRNLLIKVELPGRMPELPRLERSGAVEELVQLPLELCRIRMKGLSCPLTNAVSLLPSFMHRLEGLLLALQLRRTLPPSDSGASPVPAHLMLEAITTNNCKEGFSLEDLELLGDAFLEVSVSERLFVVHNRMQEDELSKLREALTCNATLERLGRERGLMNYIRDSQFSPEDWAAPGRSYELAESIEAKDIAVHSRVVPKRTRRVGTPLQGKTIADVVEALIGAQYIHSGVDAAQAMMGWLGFEIGVDPSIKEEARTRVHGQVRLLPEIKVAELEKLLNYRFENKGLLVEALTHASLRHTGDCYQRLEFLGDAVLGFLITRHFYEKLGPLKRNPGLLTDLRSAAVNNERFARVAVRHNLHVYLLHNCRELGASVEKYVKFVHDSITDAECHGWKGDKVSKVLSDLVESLAGAVFLDSDYNLDRVWNVFNEILKPLVTPETLQLEPTRELRELCQKQKFGDPKFNIEDGLMTVTVLVKNEPIIGAGRIEKNKIAKKRAAICALTLLKERGYEHPVTLKRTELYATKFSDLVGVPEGGCHPLASIDEAVGALQSEVKAAAATCPAISVVSTSAIFEKPCSSDPSYNGIAESAIVKRSEAEFASRTASSRGSVREEQSHIQLGRNRQKGNSEQSDGGDVLIVDKASVYRNLEPTSLKESNKTSLSTESTPRASEPELIENIEFEKLCHAYRSPSNTSRNSVTRDKVATSNKPQYSPLTRDLGVSTTRASSTTATSCILSEVALTTDSRPAVVRSEPLVPGGLSKHKLTAAENTSVETDSASSNLAHKELAGFNQASSSGSNHEMNEGKQGTPFLDDRMDVNVQSPGCRDHGHHEDESSTATVVAEYLHAFSPHHLNSSVPLAASQPRPPPEIGLMIKGEARSLLNALCMKHRWPDPVYTRVWRGGVSHAPLFRYMVQTAAFMGGQIFEIAVEGEMESNVNGAKDSAAARLLSWFGEQGIPVS